jgi:hypothetical protein
MSYFSTSVGSTELDQVLSFFEIPRSLEVPSPNFCAPKFTQVHILAFLFFLQFFPIIFATLFSLIIFLKPEINFKIDFYLFPFLSSGPVAIWPSGPI